MTDALKRYALYHKGGSPAPADIALIKSMPNVHVVDHEVEKLMLIETDERTFSRLREKLPRWSISPEVTYSRPEPQ